MLYELGLIDVITLKEAIEKAKNTVNSKILNVYDCEDRWIFDFEFEVNATMSVIFCCFKDTGEFSDFFPPDESYVLKRAKKVDI